MTRTLEPRDLWVAGVGLFGSLGIGGLVAAGFGAYVAGALLLIGVVAAALSRVELAVAFAVLANVGAVAGGSPAAESAAGLFEYARIVALALLLIHAVRFALSKRQAPAVAVTVLAALPAGFLAATLLAPRAADTDLALLVAFTALLLAAGAVGTYASRDRETLSRFVVAIAAVGVLVAVAIVVLAPLAEPFLATPDGPRFQGILERPNAVGALSFALVPFLLAAREILAPPKSLPRFTLTLLTLLLAAEVLLSLTRAGIIALLAAGGVYWFVRTSGARRGSRVPLALAATVILLAVVVTGAGSGALRELRFTDSNALEGGGRVQASQLAVREANEHPVTGTGYGSEEAVFERLGSIPGFRGTFSGNVAVDAYVEGGYVAVAVLLVVACGILGAAAMVVRKSPLGNSPAFAAVVACFVAGVINAQAESVLLRPGGVGAVSFWFASACILGAATQIRVRQRDLA